MKGRHLVIVERRYFTGRGGTTLLTHALLTDTSSLYPFEGDAHAVELESLMASGQRDSRSSSSAGRANACRRIGRPLRQIATHRS
jgi:hypothetical protein